ncbi:nucleoside diphosphate-linked moiety X motif 19-like [Polistes fuscatus]|uniref:nucleoside diphosphate-linked moiety X motif 19-like n=1 Tax=Polistes fuscatus TaxID=30207 RepID=UPI001CAA1ECB|nr:nucleoside diphosphate-linked moiety X motif 19-like [Polistes fuscatus]
MKAWKESASLILAARNGKKYNRALPPVVFQYNYKLLCLKRHRNSSFYPESYVFPGGVTHPADADLKWHELFRTFGFDTNSFNFLVPNTTLRPQIFQAKPNELPKEISLRITAIRETFEECGILLCKQVKRNGILSNWANTIPIPKEDIQDWQTKVHDDATEFYRMCEKLKCYPDLWSLHEWSNWLTPTYFTKKRYDTIFYIACMPLMPYSNYETTEMEDMKWDTPKDMCAAPNMIMAPPQYYEISRIAKFECLENLLDFAIERSKRGVELYLPIVVLLRDGKVSILPGDCMYPDNPSLTEKLIIDKTDITIAEFEEMSHVKNRIINFDLELSKVIVHNFDSIEGHIAPMPFEKVYIKSLEKK